MVRFEQQRIKWPALPLPASDRERAKRNAKIALAPSDDERRCGSPRSTKYWRASLSAASTASDPPLT